MKRNKYLKKKGQVAFFQLTRVKKQNITLNMS